MSLTSPIATQYFIYPHLQLLTLKFFFFASEQGQTLSVIDKSNYMFEMIFSLTLKKSSSLCVSIRVGSNSENNLQLLTYTLIKLTTRGYTHRRAALVILILLIN